MNTRVYFSLFRFRYDDSLERVVSYQRILLKDLEKIEIGTNLIYVAYIFYFYKNPFIRSLSRARHSEISKL